MQQLKKLFPSWETMYEEIKEILVGAEKLYHNFIHDPEVPNLFLAAPYILVLEREYIQYYKHKFPKFLLCLHPDKPLESYQTSYKELQEMLFGNEKISLGHFVNWMGRLEKPQEDELFSLFRDFTYRLDPEKTMFNKEVMNILSQHILQNRKYCVHISRKERWLTSETVENIRNIVLLEYNQNPIGLLPHFIAMQKNIDFDNLSQYNKL